MSAKRNRRTPLPQKEIQYKRGATLEELRVLVAQAQSPLYKEALRRRAAHCLGEKQAMEAIIDNLDTDIRIQRASLMQKEILLQEYRKIAAAVERGFLYADE